MRRRWKRVRMDELEQVWADLKRRGIWYNGCTHHALCNKYGLANIKHKMGYGWYKLV